LQVAVGEVRTASNYSRLTPLSARPLLAAAVQWYKGLILPHLVLESVFMILLSHILKSIGCIYCRMSFSQSGGCRAPPCTTPKPPHQPSTTHHNTAAYLHTPRLDQNHLNPTSAHHPTHPITAPNSKTTPPSITIQLTLSAPPPLHPQCSASLPLHNQTPCFTPYAFIDP